MPFKAIVLSALLSICLSVEKEGLAPAEDQRLTYRAEKVDVIVINQTPLLQLRYREDMVVYRKSDSVLYVIKYEIGTKFKNI